MIRVLLAVLALAASSGWPGMGWSAERAPPAVQAEFAKFFAGFKAALKANDGEAVAGMARLPFQNDPAVSDATQFQKTIYRENFTKKTRECLQRGRAVYDRDQDNNDSFSIFCGELIFTFTRTPNGFHLTDIGVND